MTGSRRQRAQVRLAARDRRRVPRVFGPVRNGS
jgi:hypothetical protein